LTRHETKVEALWDRNGLFGIDGAEPSIRDVLIETRITTGAEAGVVAGLLRMTGMMNPVTATVAKAVVVRRRLYVNGTEVQV